MTKSQWNDLLADGPVLLDGATGSNLMKAGMPFGVCPEQWITEHPEILIDLQRRYIAAGSRIVYAPTFTANRLRLEDYGLAEQTAVVNKKLIQMSQKAADGKAFVAGDITMTGKTLIPLGTLDFEKLVEVYKEQIQAIVEAGADLIIVETMMNLQETRAAVLAAKEVCELPVMVTMTFDTAGRTLYGNSCEAAAVVLDSLHVDAVGVNCSEGPEGILPLIRRMHAVTKLPLIAKPNAGKPRILEDQSTVYDMNAEEFAAKMVLLFKAGASFLGGCCGTAPDYIEAVKQHLADISCNIKSPEGSITKEEKHLATEREIINLSENPVISRIYASEIPELAKELQEGEYETLLDLLAEAEEEADLVELNFDLPENSEGKTECIMAEAVLQTAAMSRLPWSFTSGYRSVLERAARVYPGTAIIKIQK